MSDLGPHIALLVLAALNLVVALVWAIVCQNAWRLLRGRKRTLGTPLMRILPLLAGVMALSYALEMGFTLLPGTVHVRCPPALVAFYILSDMCWLSALVLFRHLARFLPGAEDPPGPAWLAANYGSAVVVLAFDTIFFRLLGPTPERQQFVFRSIFFVYIIVMLALSARQVSRFARRGRWRAGALTAATRPDVVLLAAGLLGLAGVLVVHTTAGGWNGQMWVLMSLNVAIGLTLAVPLAARLMGEVVRGVLVTMTLIAAVGVVYLGLGRLVAPRIGPEFRALVDLGAVLGIVLLLVPGQAWLGATVDRFVFRRSRRRRAELQAFLHALSPELGALECCQRALAELTRVMQIRGVAVVLRDGEAVAEGDIATDTLRAVWPRGSAADALPTRTFVGAELEACALREALIEADVVAVVPIASPRRRWGDLFVCTGLLATLFRDDDVQAVEAFADQLALVLEGADLLARAVAVERSLAHAEKLAAIGELAARIAHEIRNPVTAARSLAQQLGREAAGPLAEPARLILAELERVERQVAALLRFARREEYRFEPVDLGELARATVDGFRGRLEAAGIGVDLELAPGVTAQGDREKLRQVLINLIENALDALANGAASKRLTIAVQGADRHATVRVTDSGTGVPADALPHLFEPFFSLKENGTGLGLAIARRTVEAHGGRITATSPAGGGLTLEIELPVRA